MSDFRGRTNPRERGPDAKLEAVRAQIAALETSGRADFGVLPFGSAEIDGCLPGGGLPLGRWHEIGGAAMEVETAAAPAAFTALLTAPLARRGEVVWVMRRDDLWAPGLVGLGFPAERLIQVCARDEAEALSVMEDALAPVGVAAVVGEVEAADLTAGRRLQLACEKRAATGFLIRRRPYGGQARREATGSAAATRWRVASAPAEPPAGAFGLGAPRFTASLERCRGGRTGVWLLEAPQAFCGDAYSLEMTDVAHPLRLVADLGDRQLAPAQSFQRVA